MMLPERSKRISDKPPLDRESSALKTETARSRSNIYRLLSALFMAEVTPDLLNALNSEEMLKGLQDLGVEMEKVLGDQNSDLLGDLAEEYAALFIVPGGISPHESVRLHGMLNQKPSWDVEKFYQKCGLVIKDDCHILPDHIGMELEFMAYLAGKEADATQSGKETESAQWAGLQEEFFRNHIAPWTFDFLRDMKRLAYHPFYHGVASLALRFLETEKEQLCNTDEGSGNVSSRDEINIGS